jgi:2'-5' RNA ligase
VEALRERLREVRAAAFDLALGERGTFGGVRHARVVWLGVVAGTVELTALAAEVEQACRAAGLEPEERPFRAHLTLARATARRGGAALPDLPLPPELPGWRAEEFVLYESRLGHGPAVYTGIEAFPLSR